MSTLESSIERKVVAKAKALGIESFKMVSMRGSDTAWPDRMFILPYGRVFFIEFKRPGGVPSPKQRYRHEKLRRQGHLVEVHDDAARALQALTRALEAARLSEKSRQVPP